MNLYEWILFDADETLFEFDAKRGLKLMFSRFDIDFSDDDYEKYQDKTYLKEFLFTNDPTRWNLHRKENRIQPVPSNK